MKIAILGLAIGLAFSAPTKAQVHVDTVAQSVQINPVVVNSLAHDTCYQIQWYSVTKETADTTVSPMIYVGQFDRTGHRLYEENIFCPSWVWNKKGSDPASVITWLLNYYGVTKRQ